MNKAKLIKNRLTVIWSGVSRIAPKSKDELFCKRWKQRENRKGVIHEKLISRRNKYKETNDGN